MRMSRGHQSGTRNRVPHRQMVARHAKVGQYAINMLHIVVAHPVLQIPEIAPHKGKALVAIRYVLLCIGVLVKTVEVGVIAKPPQYFAAVSASAKGHIYIDATGLNVKPVHCFVE